MTGWHALLVDDSADIRELQELVLRSAGFRVSHAGSGDEALAVLSAADDLPDLVVLDVQMPGMDGWTVLQQLREDRALQQVPVLVCSVRGREQDVARAWRLGCTAYLSKPFTVDELIHAATSVLRTADVERS
jgi:DNA-binding response OmpR family regulator